RGIKDFILFGFIRALRKIKILHKEKFASLFFEFPARLAPGEIFLVQWFSVLWYSSKVSMIE
ncbi:MAG TPA: hypothetical protein VIH28_12155, partial [Ignavibacteriaceae bacterium]